MNKPIVVERYADNGEFSHYEFIDPLTGKCIETYPKDPDDMSRGYNPQRVPKPGDVIATTYQNNIDRNIVEILFTNGILVEALVKN